MFEVYCSEQTSYIYFPCYTYMVCERKIYKEKFRFWYSAVCAILFIKMNVIIMFIYRYMYRLVFNSHTDRRERCLTGIRNNRRDRTKRERERAREWEREWEERRDKTAIFKHNTFKKKKKKKNIIFISVFS